MHKNRLQPTVSYSYTLNDTLTAEFTLVTHRLTAEHMSIQAEQMQIVARGGVVLHARTFAHPTHQSTFHTDCRVEEMCTCACGVIFLSKASC